MNEMNRRKFLQVSPLALMGAMLKPVVVPPSPTLLRVVSSQPQFMQMGVVDIQIPAGVSSHWQPIDFETPYGDCPHVQSTLIACYLEGAELHHVQTCARQDGLDFQITLRGVASGLSHMAFNWLAIGPE